MGSVCSGYGVTIEGGITAAHVMFELAFNIREKTRRADTEQFRLEPRTPQFLFHQDLIREHGFRTGHTARRLETDQDAGTLLVIADHAHHHQRHVERRIHAFLAG